MDSVQLRRYAIPPLLTVTGVLALYGVVSPHRYAKLGALLLVGGTAAVAAGVILAERYRLHLQNLVEEKSYRITLRSVLAATFLTGFVLLIGLYAAAAVIAVVTAAWGYEPVSFQIFADVMGRLALLLDLPVMQLIGGYTAVAAAMGVGFWMLFPYLPVEDEAVGGPAAFVAVWAYLLGAAAILAPVPATAPASLVVDAAVAAVWGHVFAAAYKDVERYVP
ncbi:MAG: hypothetical protein ABEI97_03915 [Candidatus Nanohaloarchaea archaeon]